jgi:hypothetical protein
MIKFICVTDREVENAYCTICTSKVTSPYLRERVTRLLYCGTKCYWEHCNVTLLTIEHQARKVNWPQERGPMKIAIAAQNDQYVIQIDGRAKSYHRRFVDALREGFNTPRIRMDCCSRGLRRSRFQAGGQCSGNADSDERPSVPRMRTPSRNRHSPDDTVELKSVALGRNLGTEVEVERGLTPSDRVIDSPPDSIEAGDLVHVADAHVKSAVARTAESSDR